MGEAHLPDRIPVIRVTAMPADTNAEGDIFGGWLMSQMDLAAGSVAFHTCKGRAATVAMDGMIFHRPVRVGDEVSVYGEIVKIIAEVASEKRVLLVDRFEAMKELSRVHGDRFYLTSDNLHMNDAGHRCMAEQLARGIVAGILMAEGEQVAAPPTTTARPQ